VTPEPQALAAAITEYAENPGLRHAHGESGRQHTLRNFSLQGMVQKYDRVYRTLT
jgi:glycosyltransferase involved in cell wall biosynthesis